MKKTIFLVPILLVSSLPMLAGCTKNYTITIINNNPDMGEVSGSGTYKSGSTIYLSAKPFESYSFVKWDGDKKGTREQFSIYVDQDMTIYANFTHSAYSVNVTNSSDTLLGYVTGSTSTKWGEQTDIAIYPYAGYKVDTWKEVDGEVLSTENALNITMPTKDLNVELTFKDNTYTFGRYQQSRVSDSTLIQSLNSFISNDGYYGEYQGQTYYRKGINEFYIVEEIDWDVVSENDQSMVLISRQSLYMYRPWYDTNGKTSYYDSEVRDFLINDFYQTAFTTQEKEKFFPAYHTIGGGQVISDPVFIPMNTRYNNDEYNAIKYKISKGSDYACSLGVEISHYNGNPYSKFLYVDFRDGSYLTYGGMCPQSYTSGGDQKFGVRPMIILNKEALE